MNVDVVAGRLDMVFSTYASLKSHADQGKVRFLAIASTRRSLSVPDIPTMAEIGFSGVELDAWFGLVAPIGVPPAVVSSLNEAFTRAARSPDLIEQFTAQGVTLAPQTPAVFAEQIAREAGRLGEVVRASGISSN